MTDMTVDQRRTIRNMSAEALPDGVELLELSDGIALIRHPDGRVELVSPDGLVDRADLSPDYLLQRAAEYERSARDLRHFAEIARAALSGGPHDGR